MTERAAVRIDGRVVGPGNPAYLVAELSGNHDGDLDRAIEIIRAAAEAGADAIKLQTYTADTLTIRCDRPDFLVPGDGPWAGKTLYQLYQQAHTPWEWHPRLFDEARNRGMHVFSTPFDATAVDYLEELGVPAYKVASFELIDDELLKKVASTAKPVILSTGMANLEEIVHAVDVLRNGGATGIVVLRCVSSYPAPVESMNLATIPLLAQVTGCPVGLSDHSLEATTPVVAVTLGASLIEKHLTLRRKDGGVDSHFSLEPHEFRQLVGDVRQAECMIGTAHLGPGVVEEGSAVFRRSLYVVEDLQEGAALTRENVRSIRPGFGLAPRYLEEVLGRRASCAVPKGTALSWKMTCP